MPVLTEHVYLSNFQTTIDERMGAHVTGISGQEVTSFTHGHFNAFPLILDPNKPNLGGVLPYDKGAVELFSAIREQHPGDEVIQVNHPRGSSISGYFSYVGLDSANDTTERPEEWSMNWEAIEVFNGSCGKGEIYQDWVNLTNHGHKKTLERVDTHEEASPRATCATGSPSIGDPGGESRLHRPRRPRPPDDRLLRPLRDLDAVDSSGDVVATLGQMASRDAEGGVDLRVTVQGPTRMQIHTLNPTRTASSSHRGPLWSRGRRALQRRLAGHPDRRRLVLGRGRRIRDHGPRRPRRQPLRRHQPHRGRR